MRSFRRAVAVLAATFAIVLTGTSGAIAAADQHQVVVCKYVGTPGVNETLQTGQNPIVVDSHSLEGKGFDGTFPFAFSDAQGQSIAIRWAANSHDGDISECPGYEEPSPSVSPSPSVTPSVSPTPTPTPSNSPEPSATPSPSPSPTGTPQPTPSASPTPVPTSSTPTTQPSAPSVTPPPTDTAGGDPPASADKGSWQGLLAAIGGVSLLYFLVNLATRAPEARRVNGRKDW